MVEELPTEYDVIIIGTGMVESIVAASVARIGKRVLHLDSNSYYGHHWATFNFDALENWCKNNATNDEHCEEKVVAQMEEKENFTYSRVMSEKRGISNIKYCWFEKRSGETSEEATQLSSIESPDQENLPNNNHCSKIKDLYRKFNLDLIPKLLFSKGEMVHLLIQSQVSRYTEFISVTNILTYINDHLEPVPCSKADIFLAKNVSVINKRILMRILSTCLTYNNDSSSLDGFENKTFREYLEAQKVPENLFSYMYAIAMSSEQTVCSEAVIRAQKFLKSLGYYGNTPFLWPMYGSSELLQAYCRLCAVFGGIYYLGKQVESLATDEQNRCKGVLSNNQLLFTEHVVMSVSMAPSDFIVQDSICKQISRGILITDRPLYIGEKDGVSFFQYRSTRQHKEVVTVIELSSASGACPKGYYVVHLSCRLQKHAEDDFSEIMEIFFSKKETNENVSPLEPTDDTNGDPEKDIDKNDILNKPQILYSLYFEVDDSNEMKPSVEKPENVHLCSGPDLELDFDKSINQANAIFTKMYPSEHFLDAAPPNPNEE